MTTQEILDILQRDIHSTVFATVDGQGLPQTCVIDLMLSDEEGLCFLTARGKSFYHRLMARPFVAISGMKGEDTLSAVAISVRGAVRSIGKERLEEIFEKNPYMAKIYPTEKSRDALEVFQLYRGEGEYFDLSQQPPSASPSPLAGRASAGPATASIRTGASAVRDAAACARQTASVMPSPGSSTRPTASTAATASASAR